MEKEILFHILSTPLRDEQKNLKKKTSNKEKKIKIYQKHTYKLKSLSTTIKNYHY